MLLVLVMLTLALFVFLAGEAFFHARTRDAVALRIHVNGTRGKSSVTRLIGAGLRAANRRVIVKTTGSATRMVFEDGTEHVMVRAGPPRIIEQLRVFRVAAARRAEALVLECMALQPYLQYISERQIVRAHLAVITNVRADHLDIMGPGVAHVALALAGVTPKGGRLIVRESPFNATFEQACRENGSTCVRVGDDDVAEVTSADLARFNYVEHAENVAVALAVCAAVGVPRETALAGMWQEPGDPGAMRLSRGRTEDGTWIFADAFAANDPDSNRMLWRQLLERFPSSHRRVVVFNCRADRLDRSRQLGRSAALDISADVFVFAGEETRVALREAHRAGLGDERIIVMDKVAAAAVFQQLTRLVAGDTLIVGMGNIKGVGETLAARFHSEGTRYG